MKKVVVSPKPTTPFLNSCGKSPKKKSCGILTKKDVVDSESCGNFGKKMCYIVDVDDRFTIFYNSFISHSATTLFL